MVIKGDTRSLDYSSSDPETQDLRFHAIVKKFGDKDRNFSWSVERPFSSSCMANALMQCN